MSEQHIGLRALPKLLKGAGIKWKLKETYWQLRYAFQRVWYGYDSTDVFELGFNFVNRMPALLREFKKNNIALFPDLDNPGRYSLTEEETDVILDKMIFYFENCNEDHVYKRLFGVEFWEDEFDFEKHKAVAAEVDVCWREAMRLFSKWSMYLWY